jgi:gliding motility-associated-like protein
MTKFNDRKIFLFSKFIFDFSLLILLSGSKIYCQCCTCSSYGAELVYNGDFTLGNVGFTTSYAYATHASPGWYGIATDPHSANSGWASCSDHTSGSGNEMWIDLSASSSINVWAEIISNIQPHTNYLFSCWVCTLDLLGPGILQFAINGNLVGYPFSAPLTECNWIKFCFLWNSDTSTSAAIVITNQSQFSQGNDIALDDISFRQCQLNTYSNANVSICKYQSYMLPGGILVSAPGTYYDTLASYLGCDSIIITTISESHIVHDSVYMQHVSCFGMDDGALQLFAWGGQSPYNFDLENSTSDSSGSFQHLGAGNYSFTITDQNGCTVADNCIITQPDDIILSVTPNDTIIDINRKLKLITACNYSNATFQWYPDLFLSCNTCSSPFTTPPINISYRLVASVIIDGNTCVADTGVIIKTKPVFIIPSGFTPNHDGTNDYFSIYNSYPENIIKFQILIYNRWGQKIFSSSDFKFKWYGESQKGVYVYTISYQLQGNLKEEPPLNGMITLIK